MRLNTWLMAFLVPLVVALSLLSAADDKKSDDTGITWKKTVLDKKFRSEGVAVADVNKDGKMDILIGEVWYEAPDWKMHEIQQARRLRRRRRRLQQHLRLLGRGHQRRRLARPDRHRLPRRALLLVREPQGQGRPLEEARHLAQRLQRDAALRRPVRHRQARPGHGLRSPRARTTRARWPTSRRARTRRKLWEMHPISEPSSPGQRHPRHVPLLARPGRRRHQRRRPARRDLHRRLVGAAGEGRRTSRGSSIPPTSATPAPTCSPTTSTATARPMCSAARPTSTASGGTSRSPARAAHLVLAQGPVPQAGVADARACTSWTSTATA